MPRHLAPRFGVTVVLHSTPTHTASACLVVATIHRPRAASPMLRTFRTEATCPLEERDRRALRRLSPSRSEPGSCPRRGPAARFDASASLGFAVVEHPRDAEAVDKH